MKKGRQRAQALTELALCLAVVAASLFAMHIYIKRGFQARYRDGADYVSSEINREAQARGTAALSNTVSQYEPYYEEGVSNQQARSVLTENSNPANNPNSASVYSSETTSRRWGQREQRAIADD